MAIMITYHGYNNMHKNVGVHYTQEHVIHTKYSVYICIYCTEVLYTLVHIYILSTEMGKTAGRANLLGTIRSIVTTKLETSINIPGETLNPGVRGSDRGHR